ncbi:MAG: peptide-methionine (S)-S-oxide reductase MsrA [Caldithrix sp.]|nr:peptide-methionine (S)-S-oxide reductase MsrA [Caldithrix sp.]
MDKSYEQATLGAGCFWCVEAVFENLKGVKDVVSGYTGGHVANPTYKQVTTGETGHAEVARITFDPQVISYRELLDVFWRTHDPTTLNRQGADVGPQYRSAIFYHDEDQKRIAEHSKQETDASDLWDEPIVTEIEPLEQFYEAENYHQNFYENNRNQPYCRFVIDPKLQKLEKNFKDKLK